MPKIKDTMTPSPKVSNTNEGENASVGAPDDVTLPTEAPKESQLQEEIDQLREEAARLRDQWLRAVAETDNVRKRSQRDLEETSRYAITSFARDMAGVLENLKRASENIPPG